MMFTTHETHVSACLRTALDPSITPPGGRRQHQLLELASQCPEVIKAEIVRLEGVIRVLREYLADDQEEGR